MVDTYPSKILIGTTLSSGEFALYVAINNSECLFGAPGTPSAQEFISTLTGIIAKNIASDRDIDFDQAYNDIEVHIDCGFTSAQVPDILDQFTDDTGTETFCDGDCKDYLLAHPSIAKTNTHPFGNRNK